MSQPFINTARGMRKLGIFIPDHIPDRAIIDPKCIELNYQHVEFIGSPCSVPILASVRIDFDKFTWEPYRRPTNARPLVSRAKREGAYLGWRVLTAAKRARDWQGRNKPGHQRLGSEIMIDTLRQLVKARRTYQATTTRQVHSVLDKIISKGAS